MLGIIFRYGMRFTKYAETLLVYGSLRKLADGCQSKYAKLIYKHEHKLGCRIIFKKC